MIKPAKPAAVRRHAWEIVADEPLPINLDVRYQTGDGCFFPYAYLVYCRYDRSGTIELHFSSWVLRVEGCNLGELYAALNRHAVSFVQEGGRDGTVHLTTGRRRSGRLTTRNAPLFPVFSTRTADPHPTY